MKQSFNNGGKQKGATTASVGLHNRYGSAVMRRLKKKEEMHRREKRQRKWWYKLYQEVKEWLSKLP
jgi:hypothetical protein